MNPYLHGADVLSSKVPDVDEDNDENDIVGVSLAQAPGGGDPALVIRVKNTADVVKAQGGGAGAIAFSLAPATITAQVYSTMQAQLKTKLKEQGVDADVTVTTTPPTGPAPKGDLLTGVVLGAGVVGLGFLLKKLIVK